MQFSRRKLSRQLMMILVKAIKYPLINQGKIGGNIVIKEFKLLDHHLRCKQSDFNQTCRPNLSGLTV